MKFLLLPSLMVFSCVTIFAQTFKTNRKVQTVIQQRSIYLNGGMHSAIEGLSRVTLKVDLPPNTKSWYYSFSTTPGESGVANLNLAIQLSALAFDPSHIAEGIIQKISVPQGSAAVDVYVMDQPNADAFMAKVDKNGGNYYYSREGTVQNTRQGVIEIDELNQSTVYLGLKNPSTLDGINIIIEVAAVVEEMQQFTEAQSQAITYGDLGWKAFQRKEYDKCLQLSYKALEFDNSLGYVHFNIGLSYLSKGLNTEALDAYIKGIAVTHKTSVPKQTFDAAIQDFITYMTNFPPSTDAQDILATLQGEAQRYK